MRHHTATLAMTARYFRVTVGGTARHISRLSWGDRGRLTATPAKTARCLTSPLGGGGGGGGHPAVIVRVQTSG